MKKIFILAIGLASFVACNAQVSISSSMLAGTKWLHVNQVSENKAFKYYYTFTRRNMTTQEDGSAWIFSYAYYLTDKIPQSFDKSKVGKPSTGRYLVEYNEKSEEMTYHTIKSFNGKTGRLVLFRDYDPKRIGGSSCTIELTRVKT